MRPDPLVVRHDRLRERGQRAAHEERGGQHDRRAEGAPVAGDRVDAAGYRALRAVGLAKRQYLLARAAAFTWEETARRHETVYRDLTGDGAQTADNRARTSSAA